MRNVPKAIFGVSAIALGGCAGNFAATIPTELASPMQTHFIPTGDVTAEPPGYVSFCLRFKDQCETSPQSSIALDDATWRLLNQINLSVNDAIWPETDQQHYGRAEYWTIPTDGAGDCEDIALTKRQQLAKAGYPMSALRIAVVVTPQMERHAILTVATDKGDFVLDNLNDQVKIWNATGYRWIERQDPAHAMQWVSVEDHPVIMATAGEDLSTGQVGQ